MIIWDYNCLRLKDDLNVVSLNEQLDALGIKGWEAFSVQPAGENEWLIFCKRQLAENP